MPGINKNYFLILKMKKVNCGIAKRLAWGHLINKILLSDFMSGSMTSKSNQESANFFCKWVDI